MGTAQELIHEEIVRMTKAALAKYGDGCYDDIYDEMQAELRSSYDHEARGIPAWSGNRHYESKAVVKLIQGQWVCWLYWYGGGKHGDPSSMEWIADACIVEEGEPITVKTFKLKEPTK